MNDVAFIIFGIEIKWYAIILTASMVVALVLLVYLMSRRKDEFSADDALEVFLFTIPLAVIFARLGFVVPRMNFPPTWDDIAEIFAIRDGGLTIVVGLFGGALGILLYCLLRKKSFFRVVDLIIPCLLIAQALGRWGNFVNQELYGLEITDPKFQFFPIAVFIDADGAWHCANFIYEAAANFIAFLVIMFVMRKYGNKLKVGAISVGYLIWYGILRGTLEFVKIDQLKWGNVRAVQLICYIFAMIGIVIFILLETGVIKLETEEMKRRHFSRYNDPEVMSTNERFDVTRERVITSGVIDNADNGGGEDVNEQ